MKLEPNEWMPGMQVSWHEDYRLWRGVVAEIYGNVLIVAVKTRKHYEEAIVRKGMDQVELVQNPATNGCLMHIVCERYNTKYIDITVNAGGCSVFVGGVSSQSFIGPDLSIALAKAMAKTPRDQNKRNSTKEN